MDQKGCTELAEFSKFNFTRTILVNLSILLKFVFLIFISLSHFIGKVMVLLKIMITMYLKWTPSPSIHIIMIVIAS